jgi:hypothetical protein
VTTKEILLDLAAVLPPNATLLQAIHELQFRERVLHGLSSLQNEDPVPLEEARKLIPEWMDQ